MDRRSVPGLCVCDELFALHSASLPPSVGVIVCVDESDHQFQSQSLQIDSTSMASTPESRTHESTGRLIYTSSVHSAPLFLPVNLCVILSPLLLKRTLITDAHTWYCHRLSLGESGNSVSLTQSYLFCVRSDISMIDNGMIFGLGGRKIKPGGPC